MISSNSTTKMKKIGRIEDVYAILLGLEKIGRTEQKSVLVVMDFWKELWELRAYK
jgi:hypothetical protein